MIGGVVAAFLAAAILFSSLTGEAFGQTVSPTMERRGWIAVGASAVALSGAYLVLERPGVGATVMLAASLVLLYASGIFLVLPIPLLVVGAIIGFRNLPPAQ